MVIIRSKNSYLLVENNNNNNLLFVILNWRFNYLKTVTQTNLEFDGVLNRNKLCGIR